MGGDHPPHPKWVWTPAGGWQWQDVWAPGIQGATNKNWKRNLGMTCALTAALGYYVFRVSVRNEERPNPPVRRIPSVHWWGRADIKEKYANVGKE
mmetsp:Transcript_26839/g.63367  ORF Transcript_26839/g.63367 Transcript_26839/m.63367 type:complete len:95 (-) Transcript_26839:222-506(-)